MTIPRNMLLRFIASVSRVANSDQEDKDEEAGGKCSQLIGLGRSLNDPHRLMNTIRVLRNLDDSDEAQESSDEDTTTYSLRSRQNIPSNLFVFMEETKVKFSDTFIKYFSTLGMQTYRRLYKAGLTSDSSTINTEKFMKLILRTYLLQVKKIQDGYLYETKLEEFIECLPSIRDLKKEISLFQRKLPTLDFPSRKMKTVLFKMYLDMMMMFYQNIQFPIRQTYRDEVLSVALFFYRIMPVELAKVVSKEIRQTIQKIEYIEGQKFMLLSDKSFLNHCGLLLLDSKEKFLKQLENEQFKLQALTLGSGNQLFIS